MAGVETPPAYLQNASHGAQLFRNAMNGFLGVPYPGTATSPLKGPLTSGIPGFGSQQVVNNAGGVVGFSDFQLTQNGTPNMTVNVAGGQIYIPGGSAANQGLYYGLSDATTNLAVAAANATNPRIDTVIASVADAAYSGGSNNWSLSVVTGTATAGATLANLTGAGSLAAFPNCVVLGYILIPALATSVITANILNSQPLISPAFGGISLRGNPAGRIYASAQTVASNATLTAMTSMATSYLRGGMTAPSNNLVVPVAGIYRLTGAIGWQTSGNPVPLGRYFTSVFDNGSVELIRNDMYVSTSTVINAQPIATGDVQLAAGDTLTLQGFQVSGVALASYASSVYTYLTAHLVST